MEEADTISLEIEENNDNFLSKGEMAVFIKKTFAAKGAQCCKVPNNTKQNFMTNQQDIKFYKHEICNIGDKGASRRAHSKLKAQHLNK